MPKYLLQAAMTKEGISNVLTKTKGTGVRDAVIKFAESAGGKIEAFYFCFGQYDAVAIAELSQGDFRRHWSPDHGPEDGLLERGEQG
jgi:uncharacterized protein with GYD domain